MVSLFSPLEILNPGNLRVPHKGECLLVHTVSQECVKCAYQNQNFSQPIGVTIKGLLNLLISHEKRGIIEQGDTLIGSTAILCRLTVKSGGEK